MKKVVFIALGILLVVGILAVGCTQNVEPDKPQPTISGEFGGITTTPQGTNVATIIPPVGSPIQVELQPNADYFIEDQACPLDEVLAVEVQTGTKYDCQIYYDAETGQQSVYVAKK